MSLIICTLFGKVLDLDSYNLNGFELHMRLNIWISLVCHTYVVVILFYISMNLINHFEHMDLFWNLCPREL